MTPTTTDTTISYLSNHPLEQKLAAYRFLIDRMLSLPLHKNHLANEWQTILHIAKNNHFPTALIHNLRHRMTQKRTQSPSPTQLTNPRKNEKWAIFTFMSPNIRKVTNLLKQAGIKTVFRSTNTFARLLKTTPLEPHRTDPQLKAPHGTEKNSIPLSHPTHKSKKEWKMGHFQLHVSKYQEGY